jgi:hypothetical protein
LFAPPPARKAAASISDPQASSAIKPIPGVAEAELV